MFRGPSFIVSTMQEETTPIFKRLWYDWTQQQPGIEPTNPLGQCWVPPIVAFYDQQGLLRTYSLPEPSGAPTPDPHGVHNLKVLLFDIQCSRGAYNTFYCMCHVLSTRYTPVFRIPHNPLGLSDNKMSSTI